VTFKGAEVGMGGGKGGVDHYVYPVKPGRMIFEVDGLKEEIAKEALEGAGNKLPIRTRFVKKHESN
jgi:large subunit ribosomal protein L16